MQRNRRTMLVLVALLATACTKRDLRGTSKPSPDGKTYLVIDELGGTCPLALDGSPWTTTKGVAVEVIPGEHHLGCKGDSGIGFRIAKGTTFHFDYWGP